ncbi:aldehyde dehydrogenase family protein [Bosea sp. (in: a-proteobacteria)]|uniref:aldehyde dehydrogenase family protein n=1 Tax=Bosea sp. (in: a-proteobacteria) TaxID=1871050 RepID=UPI00260C063B|nr:aldehyde dehydrogenase family protein [Bosea sp. (in: a-proteobacteria)]MCO5089839.1 aldehyde dehydrogenase family protein [Bosea sp. (in: a-proteobacteria)]
MTTQHEDFTGFVDGRPLPPTGDATDLVDPATGRTWARAFGSADHVDAAVAAASAAFLRNDWRQLTPFDRAALLRRLAELIRANAEPLAEFESLANGKTHAVTRREMTATARWYDFYASAVEIRDDISRSPSPFTEARIVREPLGVVVAITPFNGALSLGSWKIAPALAMGNSVILKPPVESPASSLMLARLALEAGFPPGIVNVVLGDGSVGERVATHPDVAMVSFTGSSAVARRLGEKAAASMKRFVCEAGGKSAHIVFADADLGSAVRAATQGAFSATGQVCVAGSRLLVQEEIFETFLAQFIAAAKNIRIGPPSLATSHLGPLASKRQKTRVTAFLEEAIAEGATVAFKGTLPDMPAEYADGFWFAPTILTGVAAPMRICREEVFGPVVTVQPFRTEAEAVTLANGTEYGLAAGFWTRDAARIHRLACALQAGSVWVNTYRAMNVMLPFGGYKQSGMGRENGIEALDEFAQIKTIVVDHAAHPDHFA